MFAVTSLCQMTNSVGMKRCYATSVEWLWRWQYTEEWRFGIWFGWATCAFWTHPVSRHGLPPFQHVLLDLVLVRIPDVYEWHMMCLSRTWSISGSERLMACFLVLCSDWRFPVWFWLGMIHLCHHNKNSWIVLFTLQLWRKSKALFSEFEVGWGVKVLVKEWWKDAWHISQMKSADSVIYVVKGKHTEFEF